jgi:hypothetical protein
MIFLVFAIIAVVLIGYGLATNLFWFDENNEWLTTAKEAYSLAASYALAGEPNAHLKFLYTFELNESRGKAGEWRLGFCAPDGARLILSVQQTGGQAVLYWTPHDFSTYGYDVLADEKESSEAWEEARADIDSRSNYNNTIVGEWVDSTDIVSNAVKQARGDGFEGDLCIHSMDLSFTSDYGFVWRILIYEKDGLDGYEYVYDALDRKYITKTEYKMNPT